MTFFQHEPVLLSPLTSRGGPLTFYQGNWRKILRDIEVDCYWNGGAKAATYVSNLFGQKVLRFEQCVFHEKSFKKDNQ